MGSGGLGRLLSVCCGIWSARGGCPGGAGDGSGGGGDGDGFFFVVVVVFMMLGVCLVSVLRVPRILLLSSFGYEKDLGCIYLESGALLGCRIALGLRYILTASFGSLELLGVEFAGT